MFLIYILQKLGLGPFELHRISRLCGSSELILNASKILNFGLVSRLSRWMPPYLILKGTLATFSLKLHSNRCYLLTTVPFSQPDSKEMVFFYLTIKNMAAMFLVRQRPNQETQDMFPVKQCSIMPSGFREYDFLGFRESEKNLQWLSWFQSIRTK